MNTIFFYLLKSGIWISGSFLIYHLLLRRERWFQCNRFFLLFILLLSFVIPFVHISVSQPSSIVNNFTFVDEILSDLKGDADITMAQEEYVPHISLLHIIVAVYFTGVLLCFIRIFLHLFKLWQLIHTHEKVCMGKLKIISIRNTSAPFSFFHFVFISQSLGNTGNKNKMVKHEGAHATQYHSVDILLMEIVLALHWFNPFMYWMRRALKEVHEYLADAHVVTSGINKIAYQKLLLKQVQAGLQPRIASGFNYSLTKKRITMISKIKINKFTYGKLLVAMPLLLAGMFLLSLTNISLSAQNNPKSENTVVKKEGDIPCIAPVDKEKAKISSGYGMRMHPILKVEKFHKGVDFAAPIGTPVKATANGIVRSVITDYEEGKGYGMYIIIDHANGYSTLYSQLSGYEVQEGDQVKCGDIIGYVGKSGYNTGSHLHYEVMKDSENKDPADYFPAFPMKE